MYTDQQKNTNASLAYVAGAAAYLQNDFEVAQKELIAYLRDVPQDFAAIKMLVDIYLRQNQQDKALDLLETKEALIIENLPLAARLIDLYLNNQKIYKAERLITSLETEFKDSPALILAKVNYLTKIEQFDNAITLLNQHQPKEFNSTFLLTKGLVYRASNKIVEANEVADVLMKAQPLNSDFLTFKGVLLLQQQQWSSAITAFEQVLSNKPGDFNSLFNIANAKAALGQIDEAKSITTKLLAAQAEYAPLIILDAKLDRDLNNITQAVEKLTNLTSASKTNIKASEALVDIYMQQSEFELALNELDKLNKVVFLNPAYIKQKIEIYLALNDLKQATKQIEILEGLVDSPRELYELSQLYTRTNKPLKAKETLQRAQVLAPSSLLIQLQLIKLDIQLNLFEEANAALTAIEKTDSKNPNVLLVRGDLLLQQKQLSLASNKYAQALALDNNFTQALAKLYQITTLGFGQAAFENISTDILAKNKNFHFMRNLLADHYLNTGNTTKAKSHYEILKEVDNLPSKPLVLNNLANILLKEDLDLAEKYAFEALSLDDSSAAILDTYGWIQALQGKFEEALTTLRRAYTMNSNDPAINYHIGYTLLKLDRTTEAQRELQRALASEINFYERDEAQALIDGIK